MAAAVAGGGIVVCNSSHKLRLPSLKKAKMASDLAFVTSQFGGIKISCTHLQLPNPIPSAPLTLPLRPVARRVCPFTGKKANKANKVSFSNHKTKKLQFVNLQYKKIWWEAGKRYVKLRLSTKALKTIEKNGLDAVAKKAGIDLRKE
ncbi:50S ribosomal protein L28, chloroplastic [Vitis vinifera]|uniref:Large ribosomal subunit protein bL28c n=1 Tax=Vitis vinifera TaxID=29760 RepID=A0A438D053_VITVI|nr:50S ribosomal protein L28, chloroplastic [Vitis vinifera]RVW77265.1 50S ribosomal protein L28, chloroplastic [Vitis vinifera]